MKCNEYARAMARVAGCCAVALAPIGVASLPRAATAQSGGYYSPKDTFGYARWDAPAVPVWQGIYGGVHLGYGFGTVETGSPIPASAGNDGSIGGLYLGHLWQQGQTVFGIESDLGASWASGSSSNGSGVSLSANSAWLASLRGRVGYGFDSVVIYATGGAALSRASLTISNGSWSGKADDVLLGWVIGAGLEYRLAPNVSTRIEALHYRFGDKEIGTWNGIAPYSADETVIRAGLTLHLR